MFNLVSSDSMNRGKSRVLEESSEILEVREFYESSLPSSEAVLV